MIYRMMILLLFALAGCNTTAIVVCNDGKTYISDRYEINDEFIIFWETDYSTRWAVPYKLAECKVSYTRKFI